MGSAAAGAGQREGTAGLSSAAGAYRILLCHLHARAARHNRMYSSHACMQHGRHEFMLTP